MKHLANKGEVDSAEERLGLIAADLRELREWLETRVYSIAQELRRAEARDEWQGAQLRRLDERLTRQDKTLDEIKALLTKDVQGFSSS